MSILTKQFDTEDEHLFTEAEVPGDFLLVKSHLPSDNRVTSGGIILTEDKNDSIKCYLYTVVNSSEPSEIGQLITCPLGAVEPFQGKRYGFVYRKDIQIKWGPTMSKLLSDELDAKPNTNLLDNLKDIKIPRF